MFYADDEDVTNKAPTVSPNDVIDIEVSPLIRAQASSWLKGFDKTSRKSRSQPLPSTAKEKRYKTKLKLNNATPKKTRDSMKRGDPFLPSITCDENPVDEDLSSKRGAGTHKKPLDCKCKGMGFNCSPSAVLPEEMRQQWCYGLPEEMRQQWCYGVLAKTTPASANCSEHSEIANSTWPVASSSHTYDYLTNKTFSSKFLSGSTPGLGTSPRFLSSGCSSAHHCECKKDSCCCSTAKSKQDSFSLSEASEKKRPKMTNKTSGYKLKGSKTHILIGGKNNLQTMKTIACINNKENTNIISTSNFNKNNHIPSSLSSYRFGLENDSSFSKGVTSINTTNRNSMSQIQGNECSYLGSKMFPSPPPMSSDKAEVTPCSRFRHQMKAMRRSFVNIRQPLSLASRETSVSGSFRFYETRKCLPRVTSQSYMAGTQMCSCDRCKRKALLLSKMEALGFPSSIAQISPSPYPYPVSHRYFTPSMSSSFQSSNRYSPCPPLPHAYATSPGMFCPPSSYEHSSPSFEPDPYTNKGDIFPSSSMPFISRGVNTDTSSYLDSEPSLESPLSYSGVIEDITDLSIKDTVEFFMALRSPLADSQKSSLSDDASSELLPGLSSEDEAFNCCIGSCACSIKDAQHPFGPSNNTDMMNIDKMPSTPPRPPKNHNYSDSNSCPSDAPTQSMSLLYSSLMSNLGLEDELRSAIENIPME